MAYLDLGTSLAQTTTAVNVTIPVTTTTGAPVTPAKIDAAVKDQGTIGSLTYPSELTKYYLEMKISDYSRDSLLAVGNLNTKTIIRLPLPMQLIDAAQISYSEEPISALIGATAEKVNSVLKSISGSKSTVNNKEISKAPGSLALGAIGAETLRRTGDLGQVAQALSGYSPNQFLTILLKGPAYKRFSLNWKFSPKNEIESENLRQIIRLINNKKSPNLAGGGALFTFPSIFEIGLKPNAQYLYKFKPAVVEAFTCNYAGSGTPTFYRGAGAPESIEISINFLELEFWLDGQYNDNNDPYDRSSLSGASTANINFDNSTPGPTPNETEVQVPTP